MLSFLHYNTVQVTAPFSTNTTLITMRTILFFSNYKVVPTTYRKCLSWLLFFKNDFRSLLFRLIDRWYSQFLSTLLLILPIIYQSFIIFESFNINLSFWNKHTTKTTEDKCNVRCWWMTEWFLCWKMLFCMKEFNKIRWDKAAPYRKKNMRNGKCFTCYCCCCIQWKFVSGNVTEKFFECGVDGNDLWPL